GAEAFGSGNSAVQATAARMLMRIRHLILLVFRESPVFAGSRFVDVSLSRRINCASPRFLNAELTSKFTLSRLLGRGRVAPFRFAVSCSRVISHQARDTMFGFQTGIGRITLAGSCGYVAGRERVGERARSFGGWPFIGWRSTLISNP